MDILKHRLLPLAALAVVAACASGIDEDPAPDDDGTTATRNPAGVGGAGGAATVGSGAGTTSTTSGMGGASTTTTTTTTTTSTTTSSTTTSTTTTTSGGCTMVDVLSDGGFELGTGGPWAQSSTNFGSPICDVNCGGTSAPRSGSWWTWFGGINGALELASVSQTVVIPSGGGGMATLDFYLMVPDCDNALDIFEVRVDGALLFSTDGASALCGGTTYQLQSLNLNAYADGQAHTIEFFADTFSFVGVTNFMIDDVSLTACQ